MNKSVLKSKTFWFGIATAIAPLIPGMPEFIGSNAQVIALVWGAAAVLLRLITKDSVSLVD